ncbi:MAG: hypothetical protein C0601_00585 [Candidatus Muiribacterium halophilum]|uniref:Uncharacterized protein n=1 Tax=Muiribacterium halophilum TaxID=2053465 RepID=A0A2N5ZMM9_MUIH1|nr:MAG: hypothetical protein C0601_00585 [Candidatus Muirbacterium halophilum]
MKKKDLNKEELKNKQEEIKKKFRKLMTGISEKMKKKEYKAEEAKKNEFEETYEKTDTGDFEVINDNIKLPQEFPEVSDMLENLIKEYLNSL